MMPTLYVVATPIGNLQDFSPRAADTLRNVALIAAEDTRVTMKLLHVFDIHTPLTSCHQHNEEGKGAWLCSNKESVRSHREDPKCRFLFTCNGFENLFRLLHNTYKKKGYKAENKALPIFFVSGADDPVIGSKKAFEKSVRFMKDVGYKQVESRLYEGMRHEIYSETDKQKVLDDLLQFIEK